MQATAVRQRTKTTTLPDVAPDGRQQAGHDPDLTPDVRILRTLKDVETIRTDWMRLSSNHDNNWDLYWSLIRSRRPAPEPYVAALLEHGKVAAALVGRIEDGVVSLKLGYWRPVRLSVRRIVVPMQGLLGEADEATLKLLIRRIVDDLCDRKADLAVLDFLELDSRFHNAAKDVSSGFWMRDLMPARQIHRYVRLPSTFKEYARQHRRILEKAKRFEKTFDGRWEYRLLTDESDIDTFCEGADAVMSKTYQRALGVGFSITEENREKIRAAARQGVWRAFVTLVDKKMIAFWCGCSFGGTWACWWTAYDPDYHAFSPGLVGSTRMAERFISEGIRTIDFGGGDATHKERLGNDFRWEERVCIYAPDLKGFAANCLHGLDAAIGNLFRNRLKRFANRLRTPWRRMMTANMPHACNETKTKH